MAMRFLSVTLIKWPKRIPFPYRNMSNNPSDIFRITHVIRPQANHDRYRSPVTDNVGITSNLDVYYIAMTKTLWSKDKMTKHNT